MSLETCGWYEVTELIPEITYKTWVRGQLVAKAWLPCPLVCLVTIQIQGHAVICCKRNPTHMCSLGRVYSRCSGELLEGRKLCVYSVCARVHTHTHMPILQQANRSRSLGVSSLWSPTWLCSEGSPLALFLTPAASLVLCPPPGKFQFLIRFSKQGPWALIQLPPQSYYIDHVSGQHLWLGTLIISKRPFAQGSQSQQWKHPIYCFLVLWPGARCFLRRLKIR